jgi:2-polyprenyl-3-methyl-5-hydroxy-6-metoxy-1,4-benzoquinol methylase
MKTEKDSQIQDEAKEFNRKINEKLSMNFVPDLRRAEKCEGFVKSIWRDPYFIDLEMGERVRLFLKLLGKYAKPKARILDVGCGPGYVSLELARAGYYVTGIDIADQAIEVAKKTLNKNTYKDGFGSLEYKTTPFHLMEGEFDVVLFSASLHHLPDIEMCVCKTKNMLSETGVIFTYENNTELWRKQDAAQVALIRSLLAMTGCWFEVADAAVISNPDNFDEFVDAVYAEQVYGIDAFSPEGQSPHDDPESGLRIYQAVEKYFTVAEKIKGISFINRGLGGIRGPEKNIHKIAKFLVMYDKYAVDNGFMNANTLLLVGKSK